jgi:hypothetical protein
MPLTSHSTSQLGAVLCLIRPNQTAGKFEFEMAGGSWQWRTIRRNQLREGGMIYQIH